MKGDGGRKAVAIRLTQGQIVGGCGGDRPYLYPLYTITVCHSIHIKVMSYFRKNAFYTGLLADCVVR